MVEAADATLRRLDAYAASQGADLTEDGFRSAGVPDDLVSGLIKSREHYSEFDTEAYKVWILKAFSRALGRTEESVEVSINSESEPTEEKSVQATEGAEARDVILEILTSSGENLVEYDVLVGACISAGSSREDAEDAIESLKDVSMEITEPRFGFFSIST
jgi:hypothetical protein